MEGLNIKFQKQGDEYCKKWRQYVNEINVLIMQIFWKVLRFKDLNIEVWLWRKVGRVIANSLALPFPSLPSISLSPPSLPLPCSEPPYPWSFYPQTIYPHLLYPPPHLVLPLAAGLFLTSLSPPVSLPMPLSLLLCPIPGFSLSCQVCLPLCPSYLGRSVPAFCPHSLCIYPILGTGPSPRESDTISYSIGLC